MHRIVPAMAMAKMAGQVSCTGPDAAASGTEAASHVPTNCNALGPVAGSAGHVIVDGGEKPGSCNRVVEMLSAVGIVPAGAGATCATMQKGSVDGAPTIAV